MSRLLSLAHLTVLDADPLALIEAAAAGGFGAIGLRIVPPFVTETIVPVVGDADLQRRIKRRLRDTGIALLDIEAIWLKPESRIEEIRSALETGAELGAKYVLTIAFDDDTARLSDNFGKLCAAAHGYGLRTMLEFIPYSVLGTLAKAHDFIVAAAPADAGLLIDALHFEPLGVTCGHVTYDPAALFSYIHLLRRAEGAARGGRNRDEARCNRLYRGEGELVARRVSRSSHRTRRLRSRRPMRLSRIFRLPNALASAPRPAGCCADEGNDAGKPWFRAFSVVGPAPGRPASSACHDKAQDIGRASRRTSRDRCRLLLFADAFAAAGIDGYYHLLDADRLPGFRNFLRRSKCCRLRRRQSFPFKQEIIPLLDAVDLGAAQAR